MWPANSLVTSQSGSHRCVSLTRKTGAPPTLRCLYSHCWQVKWVVVAVPCQVCCDNLDIWARFKLFVFDSSCPRWMAFLFLSPRRIPSEGLLCATASWVKLTIICLWGICTRGAVRVKKASQFCMSLCVMFMFKSKKLHQLLLYEDLSENDTWKGSGSFEVGLMDILEEGGRLPSLFSASWSLRSWIKLQDGDRGDSSSISWLSCGGEILRVE